MDPHTGLNNLDYVVLGILLMSGILALFRGFVREIFSLGAWAGSYFAAVKYHGLAEPYIRHYLHTRGATGLAAVIAVFCGALIVLTIIGSLIAKLIVRGHALTAIDRSLGFIFGVLRGALVVCIVYLAAISIWWPDIDKPQEAQPQQAAQQQAQAPQQPQAGQAGDQEEKDQPPDWLMEARTRPALAYGASVLKAFLPADIGTSAKSAQDYLGQEYAKQKDAAQKAVEQQELDRLSTPNTGSGNINAAPAYDDKSRSSLDQLINQQGKP